MGVGLELSPKALALAQANADQLGLADRVDLRESDMFADLAVIVMQASVL